MNEIGLHSAASFWEIQITISFITNFQFHYNNEDSVEKVVIKHGNSYSREFYLNGNSFYFFCMVFVYNKEYLTGQQVKMVLLKDNLIISNKIFHISNTLPYDGWFILEKEIK